MGQQTEPILWATMACSGKPPKDASKGEVPKLAIPCTHVPGVVVWKHGAYGHLGAAARTIILIVMSAKYSWLTLSTDVREYVVSCGC